MTMFLPSVAAGRRSGRRPAAFALMCVTATLAAPLAPLAAQDRGPVRTSEDSQPYSCAPVPRSIEPTPQQQAHAQELASAARQAVVLGNLGRARNLLVRAAQSDPTAPSVRYYLARVLDDQGDREQALAEYCRTLDLGAPRDEAVFARERMRALTDPEGLQVRDDAIADDARIPDDPIADEARIPDDSIAEDLRISDDSTAEDLRISDGAIGPSRSTGPLRTRSARGGASPTVALALGMLVPGLGQYYSGRPVRGGVVASLAVGALASGFFVQKRSIGCLDPAGAGGGGCLPDDIARVKVSRPYLTAGIAVAGGVALLGALDAYFGARERREVQTFTEARGPQVEGPSISSRDGVAEISFFTIRVR